MVVTRSVAEKMGVKENSRVLMIHAPVETIDALELPDVNIASRMTGMFDYIHLFTKSKSDLDKQLAKVKKHLNVDGMLWVSWPKAGQLETDLNIKSVISIGYDHGLVESKTIGIDETWSAIKFTYPKKNKVYNNKYGKLKQ